KDVHALANSTHLKSLNALTLTRTDAGDDGVRAIINSGLLGRLTELDLSDGCITDRGALELAAPEFATLQKLILTYNRLTRAGMRALRRDGLMLDVSNQQQPGEDGEYADDYLYEEWEENEFFEGTME